MGLNAEIKLWCCVENCKHFKGLELLTLTLTVSPMEAKSEGAGELSLISTSRKAILNKITSCFESINL
jgi:hypothetical protein